MSLKFHRKVAVFAANGRYSFAAHPEEAARLVKAGATPKTDGVVRAIQLKTSCFIGMNGQVIHPKPPTGTALGGTRYHEKQHLEHGVLIQHRHICYLDEPLFRAVQMQCLAPFRS